MALEGMHRELLGHLQAKHATQLQIVAWEDAWRDAIAGSLLPCPECFLGGSVSGLDPLPNCGAIGQARCRCCYTVFMFMYRCGAALVSRSRGSG